MLVQIVIDNNNSWIIPYAQKLKELIIDKEIKCNLLHEYKKITRGDILVLLSCEQIFKKLHLNKHNLVVHESALPDSKGWSPLTWQILEGKHEIMITLFKAEEEVDSGVIYYQNVMKFEGHELIDELRKVQGEKTIELVMKFIDNYPNVKGIAQCGESTYYPRRNPKHSKLDINKTINEQFNLLRVCDNQRYPAYFVKNDFKYFIKIEKADE